MAGNRTLTGKNHDAAMLMLQRVCGILDDAGVHYCLDAGTLLGVVRENRLLPWDNDMDLCVPRTELPKLLEVLDQIRAHGYRTQIRKHERNDPPMLLSNERIIKVWEPKLLFFKQVLLDIFIKTKQDDEYVWAEGISRYARKAVPARFHDELTTIEFAGRNYPIPADADGYLTQRYGDWRTPQKEWDHIHDDKAIA
jgi:phosphorylcholine metabolism protein LicD